MLAALALSSVVLLAGCNNAPAEEEILDENNEPEIEIVVDDEEPEIDEDQFFKVYRNNNKCLEFSHDGLDVSGVLITFNQFKISDKDEKRLPIRIAAGLNAMFDY